MHWWFKLAEHRQIDSNSAPRIRAYRRLLKDVLNTLLLFSYAALASASSKLHANTDEYLAFNGRDRNSLMIMTHVGLWASIVLVALNKTLARQSTQTITVEEDSEVTEFDRLIF